MFALLKDWFAERVPSILDRFGLVVDVALDAAMLLGVAAIVWCLREFVFAWFPPSFGVSVLRELTTWSMLGTASIFTIRDFCKIAIKAYHDVDDTFRRENPDDDQPEEENG